MNVIVSPLFALYFTEDHKRSDTKENNGDALIESFHTRFGIFVIMAHYFLGRLLN
jgi:hypothetical protein